MKTKQGKHISCNILILSKVVKLDWYHGTSKRILVQENIIKKLNNLKIWGHNLMVDINLFQISKKRKFVLHCIAHSFTYIFSDIQNPSEKEKMLTKQGQRTYQYSLNFRSYLIHHGYNFTGNISNVDPIVHTWNKFIRRQIIHVCDFQRMQIWLFIKL